MEEVCGGVRGPHSGVIHAPDMVFELACDGIQPLIVTITTDHVALCRDFVSIAAPLGQECCVVTIIWVEANRVVAVPAIHHGFLHPGWDLTGKLEWGLDRKCLSFGMFI